MRFVKDIVDERLTVRGALLDFKGLLQSSQYLGFKEHYAAEPPRAQHPNPDRPGLRAEEAADLDLLRNLTNWSDKGGWGWKALNKVTKQTKWFNGRKFGSWRLCFLLARLQRDVWARVEAAQAASSASAPAGAQLADTAQAGTDSGTDRVRPSRKRGAASAAQPPPHANAGGGESAASNERPAQPASSSAAASASDAPPEAESSNAERAGGPPARKRMVRQQKPAPPGEQRAENGDSANGSSHQGGESAGSDERPAQPVLSADPPSSPAPETPTEGPSGENAQAGPPAKKRRGRPKSAPVGEHRSGHVDAADDSPHQGGGSAGSDEQQPAPSADPAATATDAPPAARNGDSAQAGSPTFKARRGRPRKSTPLGGDHGSDKGTATEGSPRTQGASASSGERPAQSSPSADDRRRGVAAAKAKAKAKGRPGVRPRGCTCGMPIHTEKCRLFDAGGNSCGSVPRPKAKPARRPPPARFLPVSVSVMKSAWAQQQFQRVKQEVSQLPFPMRPRAWKQAMLRFHPDKLASAADGSELAGKSIAEVSEVFMEIKRHFDMVRMPRQVDLTT